jgi:hypothetical protein
VDGGNISGSNSSKLTFNPVALSDAASNYNVVVSGIAPCSPKTSINSALVVNEPVVITSQPSPQTVCSGTPTTFTVQATGSGLTYLWKRNGVNISNSANITGATSNTLSILSATSANAGTYTVTVTGISPCSPEISGSALLTVNDPVVITTQPTITKNVCSGTSTTLTVVASGTGLTYQWRKAQPTYLIMEIFQEPTLQTSHSTRFWLEMLHRITMW